MICKAVIVENRLDVKPIIERHKRFIPNDWEIIHYSDKKIKSIRNYNELLTSLHFWESLKCDKVLLFQHDSGLLRNGIEEFLNYDYVGAPWRFQEHGGNGGLSIREVEAMKRVIKEKPYIERYGNEDVYFSNALNDMGGNLPPKEVSERFSVESIYKLGTLGYHAIDKYLTKEQVNKIMNQYE